MGVARLDKCHLKQKTGYGRHAAPNFLKANAIFLMVHGKKWGLYKPGGRSQPVECMYCSRLVPRIKAVVVHRKIGLDKIPGIDPRQVFLGERKGYACISCAKHRKLI